MCEAFQKKMMDLIDTEVRNFLKELSIQMSLEETAVMELWEKRRGTTKASVEKEKKAAAKAKSVQKDNEDLLKDLKKDVEPTIESASSMSFEIDKLDTYTKTRLTAICKQLGIVQAGTKETIIANIKKHQSGDSVKKSPEKKQTTIATLKKSDKPIVQKTGVLKTLQTHAPIIQISKNKFGNFEHSETGLIFDKDDQMVIGKQLPDGSVEDITDADIQLCKKYKFSYKLPENLDKNKNNLKNVKLNVEEINEEELDGEDFEDEEEEEDEEVFEDDM